MSGRSEQRLTKRQRRLSETTPRENINTVCLKQLNFELKDIFPITDNQIRTVQYFNQGDNLLLHGCAGTGKTFLSMYLALKEIMEARTKRKKLIIVRNAQSSKDIGFLPGNEKQKMEVYEAAYRAITSELFGRDDAYDILKIKGIIEFHGTSFLRGTTIDNAILLIDEAQNQRYLELRTVLTRTGDKTRIIICGDTKQDDLTSERFKETSGLGNAMTVLKSMESISTVEFGTDDIVRSGFVRDFIIAEYELGMY